MSLQLLERPPLEHVSRKRATQRCIFSSQQQNLGSLPDTGLFEGPSSFERDDRLWSFFVGNLLLLLCSERIIRCAPRRAFFFLEIACLTLCLSLLQSMHSPVLGDMGFRKWDWAGDGMSKLGFAEQMTYL